MKTWAVGLGAVLLAALTACASEDAQNKPRTTTLTLTQDGVSGDLRLDVAPSHPEYTAAYPNPQALTKMVVVVGPDGVFQAQCFTGTGTNDNVDCDDHPFFSAVTQTDTGTNVRIYDLFGEEIASNDYPTDTGTQDGVSGGASGSGSGSDNGGTADGQNGATSGSGSGSGSGDTTGTGSGTGTGTGTSGGNTSDGATSSGSGSGTSTSGSGGGSGTSTSGSGSGSGGGSGSGSGTSSSGSGSGSGSSHVCDQTAETAARDLFCGKVNTLLGQKGFHSRLDCTKLDEKHYTPATLPAHRTGGRCVDFWGPAQSDVKSHYKSCYGDTNQWVQRTRWELIHDGVCRASPLVLDLDGDGVHLGSLDAAVSFDLFADGNRVHTAWVDAHDGLLALDRNGNGAIDDASELFGNVSGGEQQADGFAALAQIDANDDGFVDARDPAFGELRVWRDANHDGVSQPGELLTMQQAGVKRLIVDAHRASGPSTIDAHGNEIPLVGGFVRTDGTTGQMVDAYFRFTF